MPFLKSFSINTNRKNPFPYNIPAVQFAKHVPLNKEITIFIGDNGCGKSTLLETIALKLNLPLIGKMFRFFAVWIIDMAALFLQN